MKKWPKRREFLSYYMLYKYFGSKNSANLGEIIDVLTVLTGSRNLARRVARILVRQGFLKREKPFVYTVVDIDDLLSRALGYYIAGRFRRRGIDAEYDEKSNTLIIDSDECEKVKNMLTRIGFNVRCEKSVTVHR
ncbi:hypothetical protein [Pyrofollis japonicus]|uniref:hypothetical protein n=1 Tax=Pyrofollis japonicus TaxID=3060460 RepID=UPI00295BD2E1|nr:hypothetical protein [Pyrofollis japonicus]